MNASRTATCACGGLRITVAGEPARVSACSCTQCQKRTGAPFGVGAYFLRDQVISIEGAHREFRRSSDSGRKLSMHFCPDCGSTVFWYAEVFPDRVGIAAGAFADPLFPPPVAAVWVENKHRWVEFPEGIHSFPRQPG